MIELRIFSLGCFPRGRCLNWRDLCLSNAVARSDFGGWIVVTINHSLADKTSEPNCQNNPNSPSLHNSVPHSKDIDHVSLS